MQKTNNRWLIAQLGTAVAFFLVLSFIGLWRHWGYMTSIADLGCFDQAIWMASQGRSLILTFGYTGAVNYLGVHFQPILYIFTPLYKFFPSVHWLILAQAAAISFSSLPIFFIARHITKSEKHAFIWALIFLVNPFLLAASAWDFQPAILAVFFLSLGLLFIIKKRPIMLIILSVFLLACKEHMGLAVAGLGVLYGITNRNWIVGMSLIAFGLSTMILVIGVIMPHYSLTGQHSMLNSAHDARYKWLGSSLAEVINSLVTSPAKVVKIVLLEMEGWKYIFWLFTPSLFLSFGGMYWTIPALGDFLANLLSTNPMPRSLFSYHSATIIPLLTIASIQGLYKLGPHLKFLSTEIILKTLLGFNFILAYLFAPFPFPGSINFWNPVNNMPIFDERESIVKKIIEKKSLSIQANLGPHFTQGDVFSVFPEKIGAADVIVLKLDSPTKRIHPSDPHSIGTLAHHIQMKPEAFLAHIKNILDSKIYYPIYWDDPWLILSKEPPPYIDNDTLLGKIQIKILNLKKEWAS